MDHVKRVTFRFYSELNDFLSPNLRQKSFTKTFNGRVSIKHLIESLGVPHGEIDLILVNGSSVDFSYQAQDDDRVSVYPVFESIDISPVGRLRPEPLRINRFVLDTHLGQLATYLRLAGFDCLYRNDYEDAELAQTSNVERRILLTRDRGLLKRNLVSHGYCIRSTDPEKQLIEVIRRFDLLESMRPFSRCLLCNNPIKPIEKAQIIDRLQSNTKRYYDEFHICSGCNQIYWRGSHYQRMERLLERVREASSNDKD